MWSRKQPVTTGCPRGESVSDGRPAGVSQWQDRHEHDRQHLGPGPCPHRNQSQPHIFSTWFKPTSFVADDGRSLRMRVPNALFSNWLTKHYSVVLDEALAEVDRHGSVVSFVTEDADADRANAVAGPAISSRNTRARGRCLEPARDPCAPLLLRHVHRRPLEPVRACGLPRGRGSAVALLQPAVHLRRRGPRQDAPDARDRPLRAHARRACSSPTSRPSDS